MEILALTPPLFSQLITPLLSHFLSSSHFSLHKPKRISGGEKTCNLPSTLSIAFKGHENDVLDKSGLFSQHNALSLI